ncbi:alpha-glucosidase C-terminal domain-containing protein [Psychrobacillus sp. Sa2BUA9]|uniref:Alpha-glucosidase C-terminal domain-containing protein n=1 Tax=Psychrobacillus faecigallinarum TaxID=2762235 RepID=A0ABR8R5A5_9BACI|nr:alpha-amylase family glycosyl hydrolase [Psychrobacillus faecigallinarum]MBD7942980.1 alpha-glucosidase C-terminal domain-containing protein [Psychrobacillus faecigallinarum]
MKLKKWLVSILLISSLWITTAYSAQAETGSSIHNESIYDLYVDRYFNSTVANDYNVDIKDHLAFAGGDFIGIIDKMDHIRDMGFTIISIGPVFSTESYDGKAVLNFNEVEKQFGTSEEFEKLIKTTHDKEMKLMIEFPFNNYSANHAWASEADKQDWITSTDNGKLTLDLKNEEVQAALKESIVEFATKYKFDGVKLSELEGAPTDFLNELIEALKEVRDPMYIIALEESEADFDVNYSEQRMIDFRDAFKNTDYPSEVIGATDFNDLLMIDSLTSERFTYHSALENMFPPTRIRTAIGTMLTLPGVPYMTYGTEIAMNGQIPEESHQIMNFRVDEELIEYIKDINSIRAKSDTIRSGDTELLKNENGYVVYKRSSDDETFIIVINNTSATQRIDLSSDIVGEDKELRGLFESDIVRPSDDGSYRLVIDREIVEVFQVTERKGLNTAYIVAMGISYLLFIVFLVVVWKKGKQRRRDDDRKKAK